jgi:hypothetical protein
MKRLPSRSGEPDPAAKKRHALTGHEPKAPAPGTADGDRTPATQDADAPGDRSMRGLDKSGGQPGGGR